MTEIDQLPEWVDGVEYPADISGWKSGLTLQNYSMDAKEDRIWLKVTFSDGDGIRADLSQNIFTKAEKGSGHQKANDITMARLKELWKAAGLAEADYPSAKNPRQIAKALQAYEGTLKVDVLCKQNDRGYTEATRFRAVKSA